MTKLVDTGEIRKRTLGRIKSNRQRHNARFEVEASVAGNATADKRKYLIVT